MRTKPKFNVNQLMCDLDAIRFGAASNLPDFSCVLLQMALAEASRHIAARRLTIHAHHAKRQAPCPGTEK